MENKISVIIPVYNEEKYIEKCLHSLKKQSCKNFELIVVNNNSTDRSAEIAKKFTKKVLNCKKQGISAARNYGAQKANGDILCFIDADAILDKDWISKVAKSFNKNADACYGLNIFMADTALKRIYYNLYNAVVFPLSFF